MIVMIWLIKRWIESRFLNVVINLIINPFNLIYWILFYYKFSSSIFLLLTYMGFFLSIYVTYYGNKWLCIKINLTHFLNKLTE